MTAEIQIDFGMRHGYGWYEDEIAGRGLRRRLGGASL
jgi:hypothetical protein